MKISNEERRTVARRIRQLDQRGKNNLFSTCFNCGKWLGAVYGDEDYCAEEQRQFRLCLGLKNSLAARIADLIDRPTTTLTEELEHDLRIYKQAYQTARAERDSLKFGGGA